LTIEDWRLGICDLRLTIGDWGLATDDLRLTIEGIMKNQQITNQQSKITNPVQSTIDNRQSTIVKGAQDGQH
jgi:hypothetical protein